MGRCRGYVCFKYGDDKCCYECEEQDKCTEMCKTAKEKKECIFYETQTREEKMRLKKEKVCNFIRDVIGVAVWILTVIGTIELFGDLGGTIIFAMIVIIVWLLPGKDEEYENNFQR